DLIRDFAAPRSELADLLVDPTRGTVLAQMQQTPNFMDRVHQGGLVGYVILALGALGVLLALAKLAWLFRVSRQIDQQANDLSNLRDAIALGGIRGVIGDQPRLADLETVELKLDEAIRRETPVVDRGDSLLKLFA